MLHRFKSSYQPEEGELPNWSWNHSARAEVAWSPDNHYISIDEGTHHYIGEVLLAEITRRGVRVVKFPEEAMVAATKRQWDRQRSHHKQGWISPDKLSLVLAGREADTYKDRRFEIILRIQAGKAVVVSCRDITKHVPPAA